ncbi:futalosine hydrolase [Streptomyces sp. NPDC002992]|uniref:futalosine hydrolase n=1 Tax=Streptomyces sp. NPDC002992 TaxID=3154273 RepID=UPI0033ABA915
MALRILIVTAVAAEADSVARGLTLGGPGSSEYPLPGGYRLLRHTAPTAATPDGHPPPEPTPGPTPGPTSARATDARPAPAPRTDTAGASGTSRSPEPGADRGARQEPGLPSGGAAGGGGVVDVLVGGVGPAAAAAATATALAHAASLGHPALGSAPPPAPYDLVVSAGIAGGFQALAPLGSVVVSDAIVSADLGAQTPDGYLTVEELGFGRSTHAVDRLLTRRISAVLTRGGQPHTVAPVLTVSTVTGTAERADELARRHPGAAAEAMEGFGVAEAAAAYGVPVVEIRAVSNAVGPRDRGAWRIGQAMDALRHTFQLLSHSLFVEPAP